jgi:hypothetical protein
MQLNSTVPIGVPPPLPLYHQGCGGIGTSDPPSGNHKTRLPHPNYPHLPQGRNQCRRRFGGQLHAAQILPFQLFRHHHHVCKAVGLALQIHPLVTIAQGFHIQTTTPVPGTQLQCCRRGSGPPAHAAQILPPCSATTTTITTMCCGGIGTSDPPLAP